MKKINKILSVLFSLSIGIGCFASCNPVGDSSTGSGNTSSTADDGIGEQLGMLIENGESEYSIVLPEKPSETETTAANELKTRIADMTGVTLPVVNDNMVRYTKTSKIFSVGETKMLDDLRKTAGSGFDTIDYSALNGNGFVIKTHGNSVFMDGADDRGTLYSVFDYLEKICGMKFLTASYIHTPQLDVLPFYELDITERPAIRYRSYWGGSGNVGVYGRFDSSESAYGGDGAIAWCDASGYDQIHNSLDHVPLNKYYTADLKEANAHMYARASETTVPDTPREICWTDGINDDGTMDETMEVSAVKVALESMKSWVLADPDAEFFMFGQEDHGGCCQCGTCQETADRIGRGGIAIRFVNILATEIQKWADEELEGREIKVSTFAYMYSDVPPVKSDGKGGYEPLDPTCVAVDNLYIRLAPISSFPYYGLDDSDQNAKYHDWTKKWGTVCKNFMVWRYDINFSNPLMYFPTMQSWATDFKAYRDIGVENIVCQDAHMMVNHWQAQLNAYVAGKMMWNPDLNPIELREEFIYYYYGAGREIVSEYFADLDEFFYTVQYIEGPSYGIYDNAIFTYVVWSAPQLRKQLDTLDRAIAAIEASDDPEELKAEYIDHIKLLKTAPLSLLLYNYDTYYLNDKEGKTEIAKEFFAIADYFEIMKSGFEGSIKETLLEIRTSLGL